MEPDKPLDNPIWHALDGQQRQLSEGGPEARRFPPAVTTLAGMAAPTPPGFAALARLLAPGEAAALFLEALVEPPAVCRTVQTDRLVQLVHDRPQFLNPAGEDPPPFDIVPLGASDLTAMLDLTARTQPGPFGRRTPEFGCYLGIRVGGALVAMAGERLHVGGAREISAVCTDPAHRGRGLAAALVTQLVAGIQARGELPFLHVRAGNHAALSVYARLGFTLRRELSLLVVAGRVDSPLATH